MKLSIKKRQEYLKELGFYTGIIDGKEGAKTKEAYKKLQNKYFTKRLSDRDGKYGNDTDILLRNAYAFRNSKYFKLEELVCKCKKSCTGYPVIISEDLIRNLEITREHYNKPMNITSGVRCKAHNKAVGGSSTSAHMKGKAIDFNGVMTSTKSSRIKVVDYWTINLNQFHAYCNGYRRYNKKVSYPSVPTMGISVHLQVK